MAKALTQKNTGSGTAGKTSAAVRGVLLILGVAQFLMILDTSCSGVILV